MSREHGDEKTPRLSELPQLPALRVRGGLAARIVALVLLSVLSTIISAAIVWDQVGSVTASFDLLTGVYVPFRDRLAQAQATSTRIGAYQVRPGGNASDPDQGPSELLNFGEALELREDQVELVRQPLDQAVAHPERIGGTEHLAPVRELLVEVEKLEDLVALGDDVDTADVLGDVPRQLEIQNSFEDIEQLGRRVFERQRETVAREARQAQQRTLIVTIIAAALSLLATLAVIITLRPLRRLTDRVRQLASGDWSHRMEVGLRPERDDEVGRLAREVNLMAAALEERERRLIRGERLAAVGRMAAQITHEIRNPLSSVALNAELLEDELEEATPEAQQLLGRIAGEVDRLTQITEAYLGFARRPKPQMGVLDLRAELEDLLEFLAGEHVQAGIEVVRDLGEAPALVLGDGAQLRQAFINLLRNAQEAVLELPSADSADSTNGPPTIVVSLECKDAQVTVVVRDSGPGIDLEPEELDRIFEAFFTKKAHGTGLGLPMVQQVAMDHDGSVSLRETGPTGTAFALSLPACAPSGASLSSEN